MFFMYQQMPGPVDLPRDQASVNAMKQTCVTVILAYFILFQPNSHQKCC